MTHRSFLRTRIAVLFYAVVLLACAVLIIPGTATAG